MEKKKIGGAVIGFGGMGNFHSNKMLENPDIELIGIYDIDPEADKRAEAKGIYHFPSREALLADERIDLVTIATPNEVHKEIAVAALAAGKNVISEKPVAMNSAELEEMIAASEKYGKLFTVHQNRRWDNDFILAKKIFDENKLGKIHRIESRVHGSHGIPEGWRSEKFHGGGMVLDWGVHLLDQMLTLMRGRKLVSVYAQLTYITCDECDDGFTANFVFDDGTRWLVEVETNNFIELPRWYILGENGTAMIRDWDCNGEMVLVHNWEKIDPVPIQAGAGITKTMAPRNEDTIKTIPLIKPEADWKEYYVNIVKTIRGEETQIVTHDQQRKLVKVMEAIFESAQKNEVIKF